MSKLLTYDTYLASEYQPVLTFEEAQNIYEGMEAGYDASDKFINRMMNDLIKNAIDYAKIRMNWTFYTREEKMEQDRKRTEYHEAFIIAISSMKRVQNVSGEDSWAEKLGSERKRIGDFACYIAFIYAINNR